MNRQPDQFSRLMQNPPGVLPPRAPWSHLKEYGHYLAFHWIPVWLSLWAGELTAIALPGKHRPIDFTLDGPLFVLFFVLGLARSPRMALVPSWFPLDPDLTKIANDFARRANAPPVSVHVDPYDRGLLESFAFRVGDRILISKYSLHYTHPDQLDFILAREVLSPTRWSFPSLCFGIFSFGFVIKETQGTIHVFAFAAFFLSFVIAAFMGRWFMTQRMQWKIDVKALGLTGNLDAAVATIALLPLLTQVQGTYPGDLANRREYLIRNRPKNTPPLSMS